MPPAEIGHRVAEQLRRLMERRRSAGWAAFDIGDGPLEAPAALKRLGECEWPADVAASIALREQRIQMLGQAWPHGFTREAMKGRWLLDPVSGRHWPGRGTFCFDVDWRADRIGDIKFVLELNRLQLLQPMAAVAMRDNDRGSAVRAADILLDWMDDNPPFDGVAWTFMIELALRLVSIGFVVAALEATGGVGLYRRRLRSCVAAHAYWIDKFPSLHSSHNNHRVAEGLGLLMASTLVPDLRHAARYRQIGLSTIIDAASSQFHSDGTGKEQSPTYTAFTLEMLLLGTLIARSTGTVMPREFLDGVQRGAAYLRAMLDDAGGAPRIGDDDEGRVIANPQAYEARYVASIVAAAAGVLDCSNLAPPVRDPHLRDLVFASPRASRKIEDGLQVFQDGGYSVVRDTVGQHRLMLVMDHGPLGMNPLAAHGHADALAIWLHVDGQPVFVDPGTVQYHHVDPSLREWLRSTAAHNTVSIAQASQSLTAGAFNWRHKANAQLVGKRPGPDWMISGEHDGYRSRFGLVHRRTCRRSETGFDIIDEIEGALDQHPVTVSFLIHPGLTVRRVGSSLSIEVNEGASICLRPEFECEMKTFGREDDCASNLYSPSYNGVSHGTRIELVSLRGCTKMVTRIEVLGSS